MQALTRRMDNIERKVLKGQKRNITNLQNEQIELDRGFVDEVAAGAANHVLYEEPAGSHVVDEQITSMQSWL